MFTCIIEIFDIMQLLTSDRLKFEKWSAISKPWCCSRVYCIEDMSGSSRYKQNMIYYKVLQCVQHLQSRLITLWQVTSLCSLSSTRLNETKVSMLHPFPHMTTVQITTAIRARSNAEGGSIQRCSSRVVSSRQHEAALVPTRPTTGLVSLKRPALS